MKAPYTDCAMHYRVAKQRNSGEHFSILHYKTGYERTQIRSKAEKQSKLDERFKRLRYIIA
jgi:hypothetical protein